MNVIFDVGNVIVRWSPIEIMRAALASDRVGDQDIEAWAMRFFDHELWRRLNLGHLTEVEAQVLYAQQLGVSEARIADILHHVKDTQIAIPGMLSLIRRLHGAGYPLYGLTDNVRETVAYLRSRYDFWQYLRGVVVSAEVGHLKPGPAIYERLLSGYGLEAERSVFIDDMPVNVAGARRLGMHAIRFVDAAQCENDLVKLGLRF